MSFEVKGILVSEDSYLLFILEEYLEGKNYIIVRNGHEFIVMKEDVKK